MPMLFWYPAIIAAEIWCMAFAEMPSLTPRARQPVRRKPPHWANRVVPPPSAIAWNFRRGETIGLYSY